MEGSDEVVDKGLEERLHNHARAFESLLALTPAREYFGNAIVDGQDPSEQWNRKKQTKEQKRAAKKAKLDPANQKSALDVMKERELKRKRELGLEDDENDSTEAAKSNGADHSKRQRTEGDEDAAAAKQRAKAEKRKAKREAKAEKVAKKKAKVEAARAAKQDKDLEEAQDEVIATSSKSKKTAPKSKDAEDNVSDFDDMDFSGLAGAGAEDNGEDAASTAPTSPLGDSPAFDTATNNSTASSSSSIVPPSQPTIKDSRKKTTSATKPSIDTASASAVATTAPYPTAGTASPKLQLPNIDQAELQERLRIKIEQLRAKRKADGPDGKPIKSRQDLLDQRRKRDEQRKAAKKEQRRKQKEEEQRKMEAQLQGSGSPLAGDVFAKSSPQPQDTNFSFSRLAFEDGTAADAELSSLIDPKKSKGRSDPKTALEAAQKKQARVAGFDDAKRADIAEKDSWLNAKKRAHGERVRDDTSLLKKALKRKEKQKGKSEKQWQERTEAVVKGKEMKQKKREDNLQKRKEEKGAGKGKKKGGAASKGGKKKGRPGFEGRFKA